MPRTITSLQLAGLQVVLDVVYEQRGQEIIVGCKFNLVDTTERRFALAKLRIGSGDILRTVVGERVENELLNGHLDALQVTLDSHHALCRKETVDRDGVEGAAEVEALERKGRVARTVIVSRDVGGTREQVMDQVRCDHVFFRMRIDANLQDRQQRGDTAERVIFESSVLVDGRQNVHAREESKIIILWQKSEVSDCFFIQLGRNLPRRHVRMKGTKAGVCIERLEEDQAWRGPLKRAM